MGESGVEETISKQFCAPDSDVTFQSCDGVLFKVHRRNLEVIAGGFPPSQFATPAIGEVVALQENSDTLELLFQYAYPQRQPDLTKVDFPILARLAEAAEKYEVYSAMYSCGFHMRSALPNHPIEVLEYAAKHHYPDIADEAAPLTIGKSMREIATGLSPVFVPIWIQYYEKWLEVLQTACAYDFKHNTCHKRGCDDRGCLGKACHKTACPADRVRADILCRFAVGPGSLRDLGNIFQQYEKAAYLCSRVEFFGWHSSVLNRVSDIPKFSTIL